MVARIRLASLPAFGHEWSDLRVQVGRRHVRFDEVPNPRQLCFTCHKVDEHCLLSIGGNRC